MQGWISSADAGQSVIETMSRDVVPIDLSRCPILISHPNSISPPGRETGTPTARDDAQLMASTRPACRAGVFQWNGIGSTRARTNERRAGSMH